MKASATNISADSFRGVGCPPATLYMSGAPRWQPLHVRAACICKPVVVRPTACHPACVYTLQADKFHNLQDISCCPLHVPLHVCKMSKFS